MVVFFVILSVLLVRQIFLLIEENFQDRKRVAIIGLMIFVLATSFLFPGGLIDFEKFESESLLIAQREGAANCMTTLKLNANHKFKERNVCFGIAETTGNYRIVGDTIYFENNYLGRAKNEFYGFAVIINEDKKGKHLGYMVMFENHSDTIGYPLWITKNELNNRNKTLQQNLSPILR